MRAARVIVFVVLLQGCASQPDTQTPPDEEASKASITILGEASVEANTAAQGEVLTLPDLLYAGLQALDADRLLTPEDSSAYNYFTRALAIDGDNSIAREGLDAIVARYLALAREAIGNGSFDSAELMLQRAQRVNPAEAELASVRGELARERESGDLFFQLDGAEVSAKSEAARAELAAIARQARDCEAFFLITAPNDALGRWMFMAMREAVAGFRLRGNIELSAQTGVRLRLPESTVTCAQ